MAQRGSYAKGLAKREEILSVALTVVAEHGYRKASVREIADAAGLSPAGILHHFGTKEELFVAILQARDEQDLAVYGADDSRSAVLEVVKHNASVPGLVQLYSQLAAEAGDPEHPAHAYFRERTRLTELAGIADITAAQAAGEIRADLDPAWVVRAAHALADGLQSAWMLDSSVDMAADIEQFLAVLRPPAAHGRMRSRAAAVVLDHGELLVIARKRDGESYWVLPGGGIEAGESPEHACLRELREETGLEGELVRSLHASPAADESVLYFDVMVRSRDLLLGGPETQRSSASNSYEPMWVRVDALGPLVPASANHAVHVALSHRRA